MTKHLAELRARRADGESGFTLIELLVVVVIIGILIAIAIPVYLNYQKGAKDKSAASDLRNAISVLEICRGDNDPLQYPGAMSTAGVVAATPLPTCSQKVNLSAGTSIVYTPSGTAPLFTSFKLVTNNSGGSGKYYCYNSTTSGSVVSGTSTVTC